MFKRLLVVLAVLLLVAAIVLAFATPWILHNFTVTLPTYGPLQNVTWLNQNWTAEQRDWFHHADQGTQTFGIPYEWFIALEQPALSFGEPKLLSDSQYLDRYGFIPSPVVSGKKDLPIGFAHGGLLTNSDGNPVKNPQTNANLTSLGLTCAACHTGRFTYQNTTVLVDGAPALTNLQKFQIGVGLSLFYTKYVPFRFDRFAERVLGPGASSAAKSELKTQFDEVLQLNGTIHNLEESVKAQTVEEGYARLDALNRIGNTVFAVDLQEPKNFVAYSAPVHFPRIWNAYWFAWVQYNGSIQQPMTRNAGEALGVRATVQLTGAKERLFASSAQVQTIYEMEHQLAGAPPDAKFGFRGLNSPKWPAQILPPVDPALAAKGAALYKDRCQRCHLPVPSDPDFWAASQWSKPNAAGESYLDLNMLETSKIGTDPAQAQDMAARHVVLPASLGIASNDFGGALKAVVSMTVNRWYDSQTPPTSPEMRDQMNGYRPDGVRAPLAYKVRPLNGIWATPPYLHNGSVPNLYALLSPVAERPATFYLGNREYDPVNVGYRTDPLPGGFLFDTSIRGNRNTGHEFSDDKNKPGVIGPALSPEERRQLIEFLKTL
jgi:cytochrome c5